MATIFFSYIWSLRTQFAKYFVVGISGLFIDMGTLVLFKEVFGWKPVIAVAINQAFLLTYNFLLNKYWSFKNKEMPHKQLVKFLSLAGFNYIFSVGAMYIFHDRFFDFDYRLVRLGSIAVMVSWNFFLYKYWVYAEEGARNKE
ncbi:MAG: GtrA family protein [Candidatus Magasanikbacteria bacterium]